MRKIILFCILFLSITFTVNAQKTTDLEQDLKKLKGYDEEYPKERVYLHMDRVYYSPGDDIWFKSYVTFGGFNLPSQHSKLIYVDLIGPDRKLVKALRLPLSLGVGSGNFAIPHDIQSGEYTIRAYTQWMRNFDEDYFFTKNIVILNPKLAERKVKAASKPVLKNKKELDPEGTGYSLDFIYGTDTTLRAVVIMDQDKVSDQEVQLVVQNLGEVLYSVKGRISSMKSAFSIPIGRLGDGINEIALFSAKQEPLASKIYFNTPRSVDIQVGFNKESYNSREKVEVDMYVGGEGSKSKVGTFSVSITHQEKAPWNEELQGNIKSQLLLQPYLKQELTAPLPYFSNSDYNEKEKVDAFLTIWGKGVPWKGIAKNEIRYPVEKYLMISGAVTTLGGKKLPKAGVTLLSNDSGGILMTTQADANGRFKFEELLFYDDTKFLVQGRSEKGKKHVDFKLDTVGRQYISKYNEKALLIRSQEDEDAFVVNNMDRLNQQLNSFEESILLSDVHVESKGNKDAFVNNLNGFGNADQVITEEQLTGSGTLEMFLMGLSPSVIFRDGLPYSIRNDGAPMSVLVDGMEIMEQDIPTMILYDIESVEVLISREYLILYGPIADAGLLVITTKRGDFNSSSLNYTPGVATYVTQGYTKVGKFKSPDYSKYSEDQMKPDLRTTIYWNPHLTTDKNGKTSFDFYTSDQPGKYRMVIEGVDTEGRLGYMVKEFEVK